MPDQSSLSVEIQVSYHSVCSSLFENSFLNISSGYPCQPRAVPRIFWIGGQTLHTTHRGLSYTDRVSSWKFLFSPLHRKLPLRPLSHQQIKKSTLFNKGQHLTVCYDWETCGPEIPDQIGIWNCWFLRRGENWSTQRKQEQGQGPTANSTHFTWSPGICESAGLKFGCCQITSGDLKRTRVTKTWGLIARYATTIQNNAPSCIAKYKVNIK